MRKTVFWALVGILTSMSLGCFSPYEKKLPDDPQNPDSVNEFLQNVGEIQQQEKQTLQDFIARMAEAKRSEGYGYIRGTTVRQALEKQQRYEQEQVELTARLKKEAEEKQLEYDKKKEEMESVCMVKVTKKTFNKGQENKKNPAASVPATFSMELSFENKSQKDLTSMAGMLEFRDSSGELVRKIRIPLDEEIKAGTTKTWGGDLPFNADKEADVKFANTPMEELTTSWIPEAYAFSDGVTMRLPPEPVPFVAPNQEPQPADPTPETAGTPLSTN